MCGIAGIFSHDELAPPVDREELLRIRDHMIRRGPDGEGLWIEPGGCVGLAHRRLAIIDLSPAGLQPMSTADGRLHIVFNGEIYNYRALRMELEAAGVVFRSDSDTEVLLHLYARGGMEMMHALRGMFAFAIWDQREQALFLARDAFGIKPLYYTNDHGVLRFASQVKALLAGGKIDTTPDPAGHVGFFLLGSVPEPNTMYASVRALPAGATLMLKRGKPPQLHRYFDLATEFLAANEQPVCLETADERQQYLKSALTDSVRDHMTSDVPVGVFLSSGLDSSTIAALACESEGARLRSLTLGFEEYRGTHNDETTMASVIAKRIGAEHETRWVSRESFDAEFDRLMAAMDQPSIDGVNTYFVSLKAAEMGMKVALSGLGGDELFGGYPSFAQVPRMASLLKPFAAMPWAGRAIRRLSAPFVGRVASPKIAGMAEYGGTIGGAYFLRRGLYMPWELPLLLEPEFVRRGWEEFPLLERLETTARGLPSPRQSVAALETAWYMRNQLLRDADWAGMAHSLEIRVPLVDVRLFRAVARMAAGGRPPTKQEMASTAAPSLPQEMLHRRKTGFSIPVDEWSGRMRSHSGSRRHLRNWSHIVYEPYRRFRVLSLLTDAFGGHGGIALYNRDLLTSVCGMSECREVVAIPRLIPNAMEPLPPKLRYEVAAANGKWNYVRAAWEVLRRGHKFDLIMCSHINLLPLAFALKIVTHAPLVMFIYGIDAWNPRGALVRRLLRHVDRFVSISEVTRSRFQNWAEVDSRRFVILPNAIHTEWYGPGERNPELVSRYRLGGRVVLMTLGRLDSKEQYKGFDEVLEAMPTLIREIPNLAYLIVGDGSDRPRLEAKATSLGLGEHIRFVGFVSEAEKADHYRLADAYVMPSHGEGFGFVLLEAMACGIPAVASAADGGREAVRNGELGSLVDPTCPDDVLRGIREALRHRRGAPPPGLDYFAFHQFSDRARALVREVVSLTNARGA